MSAIPSTRSVSCNLCGRDDSEYLATQRGLRIVRCRGCGLVYASPRPQAEELASLYADYHARDGENEASWDRLIRRVFREAADLLCATRNVSGSPRVLDVGCGFGGFVDLMRKRGWDAEGVDPSPSVVEAATRKGSAIRLGTLEELPMDRGPYDSVTMFYVLEHLPDPMGALRKVFDLLVPGGTLLIPLGFIPRGLPRSGHAREPQGLNGDESGTPGFDHTMTYCTQGIRLNPMDTPRLAAGRLHSKRISISGAGRWQPTGPQPGDPVP